MEFWFNRWCWDTVIMHSRCFILFVVSPCVFAILSLWVFAFFYMWPLHAFWCTCIAIKRIVNVAYWCIYEARVLSEEPGMDSSHVLSPGSLHPALWLCLPSVFSVAHGNANSYVRRCVLFDQLDYSIARLAGISNIQRYTGDATIIFIFPKHVKDIGKPQSIHLKKHSSLKPLK